MRSIEVTVDVTGGIKVEAVEFRGPDCEKSTRFLEVALGIVKNRRRKPEHSIQIQGQPKLQVRG